MNVFRIKSSGAWQVAALVTNGQDSWLETVTFYGGVGPKEAQARFVNGVLNAGWELVK